MRRFKKCFRCKNIKLLVDFYRHSRMADGRLNKCKACTKKDCQKYRMKNVDFVRHYYRNRPQESKAKQREWAVRHRKTKRGRAMKAKSDSKYRARYPEKRKATNAVNSMIVSGKWKRKPCEKCGQIKAEAHHDDYLKPLDVKWLCKTHHMERHRELNAVKRATHRSVLADAGLVPSANGAVKD